MRRALRGASAGLGLTLGLVLAAHSPRVAHAYGEPVGMLLEPTYALPAPLFLRGGASTVDGEPTRLPYTLDASIALHVPLTSSLVELEARDGFAHAFVFIPRVDLRHGLGPSFPIRTPGFYPTVRFQGIYQDRPSPLVRRRWLFELFFAHHSNGQSGCLYRDQVDPPDGRCRFPDGEKRVGAPLNHEDGSFANNELGLRLGGEWLRGKPGHGLSVSALAGFVLFRPKLGGIDAEIEELYGVGRVEGVLRVAKHLFADKPAASEVGARVRLDLRVGQGHLENPAGVLVDGFWSFRALRDWGPFVRAYWGGDPYNIRFDTEVVVLGLGMMWEA